MPNRPGQPFRRGSREQRGGHRFPPALTQGACWLQASGGLAAADRRHPALIGPIHARWGGALITAHRLTRRASHEYVERQRPRSNRGRGGADAEQGAGEAAVAEVEAEVEAEADYYNSDVTVLQYS